MAKRAEEKRTEDPGRGDEEKKEKEERREERRKTHTLSVKSKPFQTVTKRYRCLFCVVIDMSVQLAETLT